MSCFRSDFGRDLAVRKHDCVNAEKQHTYLTSQAIAKSQSLQHRSRIESLHRNRVLHIAAEVLNSNRVLETAIEVFNSNRFLKTATEFLNSNRIL